MKKNFTFGLILLCLFILPLSVNANTVYFAVDDTLNLGLLEGFDLYINNEAGVPLARTLTVYGDTGSGLDINGKQYDGSVPLLGPGYPWDIDFASYGVFGFNQGGADNFPLKPGIVLSIESDAEISVTELSLTGPEGAYPLPFDVLEESVDDIDVLYTARAVPIPSALLLLGGGLLGMLGIRRKMKK